MLPETATRRVPPDARAGDRAAARGLARLHATPAPSIAAPRRRRAGWSAARRVSPRRSRRGDARRGRRAPRRNLAAGSVGGPRERGLRAAAKPARAHARRRGRRSRSAAGGGCSSCARSPTPSTRAVQARSIDPGGVRPAARAAAAARAGDAAGGRAGRCACCSTCRRSTPTEPRGADAARGVRRSMAGTGGDLALRRRARLRARRAGDRAGDCRRDAR